MKQASYSIGTSGWSYSHWKNLFYPAKLPTRGWLAYYAEHFNTVEVNMTFYRTPSESTLTRWRDATPDDFVFTLKVPRIITHVKRLLDIQETLPAFYTLLGALGHKARCLLFQLPPTFHLSRKNAERITHLTASLDPGYDHVIEFRHPSWWCDEITDIMGDRCTFCSVNGLDMPAGIIAAGRVIYLRFHGMRYSSLYGEGTLRDYADRLHELALKNNIRMIYIYFNNDYRGYAVANALKMRELMDERFHS